MTKADAVSFSKLSNLKAIIAATADPGKATSKIAFVTSSEDSPIHTAKRLVEQLLLRQRSQARLY